MPGKDLFIDRRGVGFVQCRFRPEALEKKRQKCWTMLFCFLFLLGSFWDHPELLLLLDHCCDIYDLFISDSVHTHTPFLLKNHQTKYDCQNNFLTVISSLPLRHFPNNPHMLYPSETLLLYPSPHLFIRLPIPLKSIFKHPAPPKHLKDLKPQPKIAKKKKFKDYSSMCVDQPLSNFFPLYME